MKAVVAAMLYCGCHAGEILIVDRGNVQNSLDYLIEQGPRKRYVAYYADGQWFDSHNYISDKESWEDYFNKRLEQ